MNIELASGNPFERINILNSINRCNLTNIQEMMKS